MRKLLVLTVVAALVATAGCGLCDRFRRGSMYQSWTGQMPCYDGCTTCAPESPCGECDSCASGTIDGGSTMSSPPMLPSPGV